MAVNLDKLLETFFEESEEHLNFVENTLLQFDADKPDLEIINSILERFIQSKAARGSSVLIP